MRFRQTAELLEDGAVAGLPEPGQFADLRQPGPALEVGAVGDVPAQEMPRLLALAVTGGKAGVLAGDGFQEPTPDRERGDRVLGASHQQQETGAEALEQFL